MLESKRGILLRPEEATALLVLGHGAGAGMRHAFMAAVSEALCDRGIATFRYEFPYMAAGRKRPDRPPILVEAVREAVAEGHASATDLPLFVGGKSMGGRMSSTAAAEAALAPSEGGDRARGLVFFGFPLHSAGEPGTARARHLSAVDLPMLFLQGDRDKLSDLDLLRPVVESLGEGATLHVVRGADHGFHVLKRSGRTDDEVVAELATVAADWMRSRVMGG